MQRIGVFLQLGDGLACLLGCGKTRALQQQAAIGGHQLEVELAVFSRYCLKLGSAALVALAAWGAAVPLGQAAQAHGRAQLAYERRGQRAARSAPASRVCSMRSGWLISASYCARMGVITLAHALQQQLFGVAPGNAVGILLAQGGGLLLGGKGLVNLEQR